MSTRYLDYAPLAKEDCYSMCMARIEEMRDMKKTETIILTNITIINMMDLFHS